MATWTIANLEYNNDANKGVVIAHWRVTEEETVGEDTYTASSYGTASFEPDASADGYVAYDSLTEETVIGWVKESMISTKHIPAELDEDGNEVTPATIEAVDGTADIEANLQAQIDEQKIPTTVSGVPWNNPVAEAA